MANLLLSESSVTENKALQTQGKVSLVERAGRLFMTGVVTASLLSTYEPTPHQIIENSDKESLIHPLQNRFNIIGESDPVFQSQNLQEQTEKQPPINSGAENHEQEPEIDTVTALIESIKEVFNIIDSGSNAQIRILKYEGGELVDASTDKLTEDERNSIEQGLTLRFYKNLIQQASLILESNGLSFADFNITVPHNLIIIISDNETQNASFNTTLYGYNINDESVTQVNCIDKTCLMQEFPHVFFPAKPTHNSHRLIDECISNILDEVTNYSPTWYNQIEFKADIPEGQRYLRRFIEALSTIEDTFAYNDTVELIAKSISDHFVSQFNPIKKFNSPEDLMLLGDQELTDLAKFFLFLRLIDNNHTMPPHKAIEIFNNFVTDPNLVWTYEVLNYFGANVTAESKNKYLQYGIRVEDGSSDSKMGLLFVGELTDSDVGIKPVELYNRQVQAFALSRKGDGKLIATADITSMLRYTIDPENPFKIVVILPVNHQAMLNLGDGNSIPITLTTDGVIIRFSPNDDANDNEDSEASESAQNDNYESSDIIQFQLNF